MQSTATTRKTFQSTPSAWRETRIVQNSPVPEIQFQSTPSAWRETNTFAERSEMQKISIHSLRMEGDLPAQDLSRLPITHFNPLPPHGGRHKKMLHIYHVCAFQSTPSAWRETSRDSAFLMLSAISIHSLRMEGDICGYNENQFTGISIHSLRMEGDRYSRQMLLSQ